MHPPLGPTRHRRPASCPEDENLHPLPQQQPAIWGLSSTNAEYVLQARRTDQPDRTLPAKGGEGGEIVCEDQVSSAVINLKENSNVSQLHSKQKTSCSDTLLNNVFVVSSSWSCRFTLTG